MSNKELLYKKLTALRLEVRSSIVDDIVSTVDDLLQEQNLQQTDVVPSLPDIYSGELNTRRINAYKKLHQEYNIEEGTVRDIFCKGADWYKEIISTQKSGAVSSRDHHD